MIHVNSMIYFLFMLNTKKKLFQEGGDAFMKTILKIRHM